jgi:DNA helicase HerA-like ATPase
MNIQDEIKKIAKIDIFKEAKKPEAFVGRPFYLDYEKAFVLIADAWKERVKGIPQGTFLLAFYENEELVTEALLLRALNPTTLPTDSDVMKSMLEYYKDNLKTAGTENQLDQFTKYQFSFSGLECRVLGTFYRNKDSQIVFGADVENFYSAHNYSVYKPTGKALEAIVNYRALDEVHGNESDLKIGKVRYSSSRRFQENLEDIPLFISSKDFLGKRTALFGMTRTGKSNTVKKIIEAAVEVSKKAKNDLSKVALKSSNKLLSPFDERGCPNFPIGQIIFDINGEYANANLQDEGTAIFELYKEDTIRYSVIEKEGFKIMKVNFYKEIETGFSLINNHFKTIGENSDYVNSFLSVSLEKPDDYDTDVSVKTRYDRKVAAYMCCLYQAGFLVPEKINIKFQGQKEINDLVRKDSIDPSKGISFEDAVTWFTNVWDNYKEWETFKKYKETKGREWADEELKAILGFLTRHKEPGSSTLVSGYLKIKPLMRLHTSKSTESFENEIVSTLRTGKIVIIDLSQGDPEVQQLYAERICSKIFADAMVKFTNNKINNFIQFYFEEAHNLFPKKDDKDLSQIYNRIAKEGAKLNLGLIYATQEVSSISSNILKNTQNWFIAHLNNDDELKELKKYYDFTDFTGSLVRFSSNIDRGFVRVKTYSNPFVVPVQVDRFSAKK